MSPAGEIPPLNVRAQLVPLDGGSAIEISRDLTLVGRKEECDIRLDHKSVSKLHCIIVRTDGLLLIRDLGSTNGTRVNGQRIRRGALLPNDQLTIANLHFRILLGGAPEAPAPSPDEHTMRMEDKERLQPPTDKPNKPDEDLGDSAVDMKVVEVQANALPDVYPESK